MKKNRISIPEFNPTTGKQMLRFFDILFKKGVIDASSANDDFFVREFYDSHHDSWTFGWIEYDGIMDWYDWQFGLYRLARENGFTTLAMSYIFRLYRPNYCWCLLPFCMRFYLLGVSEWLAFPNPSAVGYFKVMPRRHWDPNCKMPMSFQRQDYFSYLQQFAFEFRHAPVETQTHVRPTQMDLFVRALYDVTSKYVTRRQLQAIAAEAVKNLPPSSCESGQVEEELHPSPVWSVLPFDQKSDVDEKGRQDEVHGRDVGDSGDGHAG